ncbi:MAG: hypothetical protein IKM13_12515 [Clostridia bacterium]|nr:hypothetical protein [Clostridia bacterium]
MICLEHQHLKLHIDPEKNRATLFTDCYAESPVPFLAAELDGAPREALPTRVVPPTRPVPDPGRVKAQPVAMVLEADILTAFFADAGEVALQIKLEEDFVTIRVLSCPERVEKLHFGGIFCPECGEEYKSAGMALNLHTNSDNLLGVKETLGAVAFRRFGIVDAAFAVLLAKNEDLRAVMGRVTRDITEDIPWNPKAGAFADDYPDVRYSYLMNHTGITMDTVENWIALANRFGAKQLDFHGGYSFRFGDLTPNSELYPGGKEDFKRVIDRLHDAGIQAGLHTYAQFIDMDSSYVTPVPHPGLGGYPFTLACNVDEGALTLPVLESTAHVSTKTGFFVRNSVYLMADEELMRFDGVGEREFRLAERGALGTTAAPHRAGCVMKHLLSCFGRFAPDPEGELYLEIARNTAEFYNEMGFDMIYLDAIDGSDIFAGAENAWYYGAKFVAEILKYVKKPPILEMSEMWHHFWYFRTRMGAWDHSNRGHKYLLGEHNQSNLRVRARNLLPQNYGWWSYGKADPLEPIQTRRQFLDDYEFWAGNALKNDWSHAFLPGGNGEQSDEMSRFAARIGEFEALRLGDTPVDWSEIGEREVMLVDGKPVPVTYQKVLITSYDAPSVPEVPAGETLCRLRVENRPYPTGEKGPALLSGDTRSLSLLASKNITASLKETGEGITLTATQSGQIGYAKIDRPFPGGIDLSGTPGLYVMVQGDGKGEVLDLQLKSQKYALSGTLDRVITVDFVGWKCFNLIESDGGRLGEDYWPFSGGGHYNPYDHDPVFTVAEEVPLTQYEWHPSGLDLDIYFTNREKTDLREISMLSVWMNHMRDGEEYQVTIGEISLFPIDRKPVSGLVLTVNGIDYPVGGELPVDAYLELEGGRWYAYDLEGKLLTGLTFPKLPVSIPEGSRITARAEGDYGLELTIGTTPCRIGEKLV